MKIKAAVLNQIGAEPPYDKSKPLSIDEFELDDPGHGEVMVKIGAAGLCHSDLSVIDGNRPRPTPMVLGHEAAGTVEKLGPSVDDLKVGDHVVMVFVPSCGHCLPCAEGRPALCEPGAIANNAGTLLSGARRLHRNGGDVHHHLGCSAFAEYATVSRRSLVKIDQELPFDEAALFGCAVLTGVGAVINTAKVSAGSSVAVIGLGGVGLSSLLGAVAVGARRIVAVDLSDDKLGLARQLGATDTFNPGNPSAIDEIRSATAGGVEFAFEMAGSVKAMDLCLQDHAARGNHYHGGVASTQSYICAASGKSCRRGANHQGQLHRHLCADSRSSPLHRALSRRQVARRSSDERAPQARRDQPWLRSSA